MYNPPIPYREQWVTVTYYTASDDECGKSDGITASGTKAVEGVTVAADHLPFGTLVEIDGATYEVQDRFGGGYTDKIDVFTEDRSYAIQMGKQRKKIRILEGNQ